MKRAGLALKSIKLTYLVDLIGWETGNRYDKEDLFLVSWSVVGPLKKRETLRGPLLACSNGDTKEKDDPIGIRSKRMDVKKNNWHPR